MIRSVSMCSLAWIVPAAPSPAQDPGQDPAQNPATLEAARTTVTRTIEWIERQAVPVPGHDGAILFRESADRLGPQAPQIYGGTAGVLFFLENAASALNDARARTLA